MHVRIILALFVAALVAGCVHTGVTPRMTEQQVIRIAKQGMIARFPDSVGAHEPYHAEFSHGTWSVWGTVPAGVRGGGSPEVTVRDSDGVVMQVYLSR